MSTTVHVKNISHATSEKEVRDFFSFCGKITYLTVTPTSGEPESPQSATVTFEKDTAAKTALLLDNTQLGTSHVTVTSASSIDEIAGDKAATSTTPGTSTSVDDLDQEDKPRSRIVAEYLAHGYVIGDGAISRAIALDQTHGFSTRFTSALKTFDEKTKATDRAKAVDASYGVTNKAAAGWKGLNSYFEKAIGTPTGQKIVEFYSKSQKQVEDIHKEALRLKNLKQEEAAAANPAGETTVETDQKESTASTTKPASTIPATDAGPAPEKTG